ncbi:MAG: hypothetical protein O7B99_06840, partial [Planctomycetota bacterium]|nr:hypothetical protein [Planctomycetota bacterium]
YHRVGCVACHGARETLAVLFDDEFLPDELPAVPPAAPLRDLGEKWRPVALERFLRDPAATHPDGRMPSFDLSLAEARQLAGYLLEGAWWELGREPDAAAVARGRETFGASGCTACHEHAGAPEHRSKPLGELNPARGCLDPDDTATPRYDLTRGEYAALAAGLRSVQRASGAPAPLDAARRRIAALGCASCHVIDGAGGPDEELDMYFVSLDEETDLGDEGRLPPDLSGVGFKLTTSWLREVLAGEGRARPYLAARMPRYAEEHVDMLPGDLARLAGVVPDTDALEPVANDELVMLGRGLMDRTQLSCVACHVYKDFPPNGTAGPDMTAFAERLRYEWYVAYMQDPMRYKAGTRMPSSGFGGVSTLKTVLDGDLYAQFDAMWAYFTLGEFMPLPDGVSPARTLQIPVREKPTVLRTFLENTGSRGIAVGYPVGVHFAFDAQACRLVEVWKGDFLDASGAWAGRGGRVAGGRGPVIWKAPEGPAISIAGASEASFRGYRFDDDDRPVLFYDVGATRVEERWIPHVTPSERFERSFELSGVPAEAITVLNLGPGEHFLLELDGQIKGDHVDEQGNRLLEIEGLRTIRMEVKP